MNAAPKASRRAQHLAAALGAAEMPDGVRAMGERVLERLSAPVRIAVMGRIDAGIAGVVNGLLGGAVVPECAALPPLELTFGTDGAIGIVGGDGRRDRVDRHAFDLIDPRSLALVEISAPLPLLERATFLTVPLDPEEEGLDAAIAWTARRADMVIWCAEALTAGERALWHRLPQPLRDHGFLALTGPEDSATADTAPAGEPMECGFRAVHRLDQGESREAGFGRFRAELLEHVSAARRQDLEGALLLLDRYLPGQSPVPADAGVQAAGGVPDFAGLLDTPRSVAGAVALGGTAGGLATEIISFLSAQASELSRLCDVPTPEALRSASQAVLGLCAESIDACSELAAAEGGPLSDVLAEASDLILLMQLEATASAMDDAVALLLQVRHECESQLCA